MVWRLAEYGVHHGRPDARGEGGIMFFTPQRLLAPLICSVLLDHYGWVGFEVHPVNTWRMVGCALLLAGLFLVSKF